MHVQPPLQRKQVSQTHVHSSQQHHHHPLQHDHHRHRYNVVAPHNVDYSYSYSWSHALPVAEAQTSPAPATPVLAVPRATSAITLPTRHHPRHTVRHTSRTTGGGAGGGAGASGAPGAGAHLVVVSMSRQKHSTNATARSKSRRKLASLCRRRKHEENASTKSQVQAFVRGHFARQSVSKWELRQRELTSMQALRQAAAIAVQRVWRGHVGRCIAAERAKEMVAFVRYLHRKELLEAENDFYRTHTLERWKRDWRRWRHGPATAKTATRSDVCVIQ